MSAFMQSFRRGMLKVPQCRSPSTSMRVEDGRLVADLDWLVAAEISALCYALEDMSGSQSLHFIKLTATGKTKSAPKLLAKSSSKQSVIHHKEHGERLCRSLSSLFSISTNLQRLELDGIFISPIAASHLARGIAQSAALCYLSLARTTMGDASLEELISALPLAHKLQVLVLAQCNLSDLGGIALADNLQSFSLTSLDLSGNFLGDPTATQFSITWPPKGPLTSVDFSANRITNSGAELLAALAGDSSSVLHINLTDNYITDPRIAIRLDHALSRNLRMSTNGIALTSALEDAYKRIRFAADTTISSPKDERLPLSTSRLSSSRSSSSPLRSSDLMKAQSSPHLQYTSSPLRRSASAHPIFSYSIPSRTSTPPHSTSSPQSTSSPIRKIMSTDLLSTPLARSPLRPSLYDAQSVSAYSERDDHERERLARSYADATMY